MSMLVSLEVERERDKRSRAQEETIVRDIRGQRVCETSEMNGGTVAQFGIKRSGEDESTQHGKRR